MAQQVNVEGTRELARIIARTAQSTDAGGKRAEATPKPATPCMVFTSTDWVYDGTGRNVHEDSGARGFSVYGRSKAAAEQAVAQVLGERALILRSALVFGPPSPINPRKRSTLGWMMDALHAREQLTVFDNEFRTPVFVHDLARAFFALTKRAAASVRAPPETRSGSSATAPQASDPKQPPKHPQQQQQQHRLSHLFQSTTPLENARHSWYRHSTKPPADIGDGNHDGDGGGGGGALVFNMGGPERVSRLELAMHLARVMAEPTFLVQAASIAHDDTSRPKDVSMDSEPFWDAVGVTPTKVLDAIVQSVTSP